MRMRWLANLLAPRLKAWAGTRVNRKTGNRGEPDFRVVAEGDDYLRRWIILYPRWWRPGLYLHQMIRDDDAVLHDHPYWSVSLCLSEGLREVYQEDPARDNNTRSSSTGQPMYVDLRYPQPGDIILRSSRLAHQLRVMPGSDPWTLFFTGRRLKKGWGFWCRRGWVSFKEYANVGDGKSGVGRGCGEL